MPKAQKISLGPPLRWPRDTPLPLDTGEEIRGLGRYRRPAVAQTGAGDGRLRSCHSYRRRRFAGWATAGEKGRIGAGTGIGASQECRVRRVRPHALRRGRCADVSHAEERKPGKRNPDYQLSRQAEISVWPKRVLRTRTATARTHRGVTLQAERLQPGGTESVSRRARIRRRRSPEPLSGDTRIAAASLPR